MKVFNEAYSAASSIWIKEAIDDCSLWDFPYYLYLYCITEYTEINAGNELLINLNLATAI